MSGRVSISQQTKPRTRREVRFFMASGNAGGIAVASSSQCGVRSFKPSESSTKPAISRTYESYLFFFKVPKIVKCTELVGKLPELIGSNLFTVTLPCQ